MTAEQIEARIAALKTARDSGVLIVRHGDTSTQFRSLREIMETIAALQAELATVNGTTRSRVRYVRQVTKGY